MENGVVVLSNEKIGFGLGLKRKFYLASKRLFDIIVSRKRNQKGLTAGVVPIFIKAGKTDSEFIKNKNSIYCNRRFS